MLSVPAYLSYLMYNKLPIRKPVIRGGIVGAVSVMMTVCILIMLLALTDARFASGDFSVAQIAVVGHLPLMIAEAFVTGFAVQFLEKNKKSWVLS